MILFLLFVSFNISDAFKFGPKYDVFAKFLNLESTVSKLKRLSPERLLQKRIKSDFEIAVTKSYGDLRILKKKSSTEFEFFHASTNNRILYGQKKHLTTEVEIFFEGKSLDDFDLIGGFDPSLNLVVREKSTKEIQIFKKLTEDEEDEEIILKTDFLKYLALINFDEYNVAILPGYQFISQNKEKNTRLPFIRDLAHENIEEKIEKCLYIDLMKTNFAKIHSLSQSVQLLKLFAACGAKLPKEQFFREPPVDYVDESMSRYLETLVVLSTNEMLTDKIEPLNCETIETENYGNLQISKDKDTQEVKFVSLDTNLECLEHLKKNDYFTELVPRLVSKFAPIKQNYKFYGSQDAIEFYAVNTDTGKVIDVTDESNGLVPKIAWYQKLCVKFLKLFFWIATKFQPYAPAFILRFVAFIITKILGEGLLDKLQMFLDSLRMKAQRSSDDEYMHKKRTQDIQFLESVNLCEYDVLVGIQNGIFLVHKTYKDIRYFSAYDEYNEHYEPSAVARNMFKELKKCFSRSKPFTQQDYINFLKKTSMRPSLQILMMFNQNGMKIDDRICENFENFQGNYVRCLYERVLMLKMFQNQLK